MRLGAPFCAKVGRREKVGPVMPVASWAGATAKSRVITPGHHLRQMQQSGLSQWASATVLPLGKEASGNSNVVLLEAELATFITPATPSPTLHLLSSRAVPEAPYDLICFDFNLLDTPVQFRTVIFAVFDKRRCETSFLVKRPHTTATMSDQVQELLDVPSEFARDGLQFMKRCTKRKSRPFPAGSMPTRHDVFSC